EPYPCAQGRKDSDEQSTDICRHRRDRRDLARGCLYLHGAPESSGHTFPVRQDHTHEHAARPALQDSHSAECPCFRWTHTDHGQSATTVSDHQHEKRQGGLLREMAHHGYEGVLPGHGWEGFGAGEPPGQYHQWWIA